jgi:ADP-ribose pyrophosphatase YjhB (NUDIX family)
MCRLQRDDGRILLVKPTYRNIWTLPGGLTDRGEQPIDCMQRELGEETGMRGDIVGEPTIVVDLRHRVIDFVYHARVPADLAPEAARAVSLEIGAVGWFAPDSQEALTGEVANRVLASETALDAVRLFFAPAKSKGSTGRRRQ